MVRTGLSCKGGTRRGGRMRLCSPDKTRAPPQGPQTGNQSMNMSAQMEQEEVLRIKLEMLRREHRDLDEAIHALQERGSADMLTIRRLKKQKLALKDQIRILEDRILPDIIA
jgi:hypothetical protein